MKIKNMLFMILFAAWVALWAFFMARGVFLKGGLDDYRCLLRQSVEGKRSYTAGARLYEFLVFCNGRLPAGASYELAGIEDQSHDQRRASYYLYPHVEKKGSDYKLVYGLADAAQDGCEVFARLDADRYILKRK